MTCRISTCCSSGSPGKASSWRSATSAGLRPGSLSVSCLTPSSSRGGRWCSTEASFVILVKFVTLVKTCQTTLLSEDTSNRSQASIPLQCVARAVDSLLVVVLRSPFLPHVHRKGDLGDEVDGMKGDTIKSFSNDDGSRKRGVPCGHLSRHISQDSLFFHSCLLKLSGGEASISVAGRQRRRCRLCEQLRRDGADAELCKCRWSTCAKQWIFVSFEMRSSGFCNFLTCWRKHGWMCPERERTCGLLAEAQAAARAAPRVVFASKTTSLSGILNLVQAQSTSLISLVSDPAPVCVFFLNTSSRVSVPSSDPGLFFTQPGVHISLVMT